MFRLKKGGNEKHTTWTTVIHGICIILCSIYLFIDLSADLPVYKLSCLRRAAEDGTLWESNPKFADGESFLTFSARYLVFNSTIGKRWQSKKKQSRNITQGRPGHPRVSWSHVTLVAPGSHFLFHGGVDWGACGYCGWRVCVWRVCAGAGLRDIVF